MATSTTPRSTIHAFWDAFVPSAIFLLIYLAIFVSIVGNAPLVALQRRVISLTDSDVVPILKAWDLLKVAPVAAIFAAALLLYVFDRLVLGLGRLLPPYPFWRGSQMAWVPAYLTRSLWQLLDRPEHLSAIDVQVDTLVNRARAEQKEFLLSSLTYGETQFSFAANLFAYGKGAVIWSTFCAVWALLIDRQLSSVILNVGIVWLLAIAFCIAALALETHYLIENAVRRARIAEGMLHLQGKQFEPGATFDAKKYEAIEYGITASRSHRFVGLSWGSLDDIRRAFRFFVPKGRLHSPVDLGKGGPADR